MRTTAEAGRRRDFYENNRGGGETQRIFMRTTAETERRSVFIFSAPPRFIPLFSFSSRLRAVAVFISF
jgi:hypothetical protein